MSKTYIYQIFGEGKWTDLGNATKSEFEQYKHNLRTRDTKHFDRMNCKFRIITRVETVLDQIIFIEGKEKD